MTSETLMTTANAMTLFLTVVRSLPWLPPSVAAVLLATLACRAVTRGARKREAADLATLEDMAALGEVVPDTIHPVIDLDVCIGSGACVSACPEKTVLGIV